MSSQETTFWDRAQALDRRWVFLAIFLSVVVPMYFDLRIKEPATPEVAAIFDAVDALPQGAQVLVSFDFDPASRPELQPMAKSYLRHLFVRSEILKRQSCEEECGASDAACIDECLPGATGLSIYCMSLWPFGPAEATTVFEDVITPEFPDLVYGEDYVVFGYRPGARAVIQVILNDFQAMFKEDIQGVDITEIPVMANLSSLRDLELILDLSAGDPGLKQWIQFGGDEAGVPVAGGVTAVGALPLYPYYPTQMFGIMGGMKAAAEYETMLADGYPEQYGDLHLHDGIGRMGPQTFAHLAIILFIVVGNIGFFATLRGRSRERLKALRD